MKVKHTKRYPLHELLAFVYPSFPEKSKSYLRQKPKGETQLDYPSNGNLLEISETTTIINAVIIIFTLYQSIFLLI
jgi:hypothetical protein